MESPAARRPFVVGLGGTTRPDSSTERALRHCLRAARELGADTLLLGAEALQLPLYSPDGAERTASAQRLVEALRAADGVIVATPGYHGSMSGLVKNALDYVEDLRDDPRPYLDGRAVGCVVCAHGWQATVTTLVALRSVVHALRGWPTPMGVGLNSATLVWDDDGELVEPGARANLGVVARQLVQFAGSMQAVTS